MCHGCHACQSGLRAHVQRAKAASIFQLGLPACQRRANYSIWRAKKPKGVPVFQLFFKRKYFFNFKIFQSWLTFANFKNIWAILENLSHETKNLNFDIYCLGTTVLENIVIRNGKKHSNNKVSYNYLGSPTQAHHNSRRSQHSHAFFILFSCFSCGKFEKTLVCYIYRNQVFLYIFFLKLVIH